jgi:hypothetical protein
MANPEKTYDVITPPAIPCPLWLRGDCPCPKNPEKECPNWQSGECRPGLRGDVLIEIRKGEKDIGKVLASNSDPYLRDISFRDNNGALREDVDTGDLKNHPLLSKLKTSYFEGITPTDNPKGSDNPKALETEANRLQNRLAYKSAPTFRPPGT